MFTVFTAVAIFSFVTVPSPCPFFSGQKSHSSLVIITMIGLRSNNNFVVTITNLTEFLETTN